MGGIWNLPDRTTQDGTSYQINIENCFAVIERYATWFLVEPMTIPSMKVYVNGGYIFNTGARTLSAVNPTSVSITAANPTNPRKDVIEMNDAGTVQAKTGTAAASPAYPTLTTGFYPIAGIYVPANATTMWGDNITDLRFLGGLGIQEGDSGVETYTTAGSYTFTAKKTAPHLVTLVGGGGGGAGGDNVDGGGGGGGAECCTAVVELTKGVSYTIVVGTGGTHGEGMDEGSNGTASKFSSLVSATGGYGGESYGGSNYGGAGGAATAPNTYKLASSSGEEGESAAGVTTGGDGGNAGCAMGLGGSGGTTGNNGNPGTGYGSGGGGGGSTQQSGGNGADGYIKVAY